MILLGVLLIYFDVATGMVIFSVIQFVANGWRTVLWWRFVKWRIFFVYVAGAVISFSIMRTVAIVPSKAAVYISLGLLPFLIELLPTRARPNIEWRGVPFVTGFLTTIIQLLTGVGGLFLDIFFQKSTLDRKTTIATKAVTQTFSHVVRAVYFGSFIGIADAVPLWLYRAGDRALDRGHVARGARARAHDRRRLPAMDAARDLRGQYRVSRARRDAGAGVVSYWLAHMMRAIHSTSSTDKRALGVWRLSERSSTDLAVRRLSSFTITSPSRVFTTTRSPRRIGADGDTTITVPSR